MMHESCGEFASEQGPFVTSAHEQVYPHCVPPYVIVHFFRK